MAVLGFLLTALTLLGPLATADRTTTSTHCLYSNSTIESIYPYSEKELSGSRNLRLSRYSGKVNDTTILFLIHLNGDVIHFFIGGVDCERSDLLRFRVSVPRTECTTRTVRG